MMTCGGGKFRHHVWSAGRLSLKTGVHYKKRIKFHSVICGLDGLVVSALDFQAGYHGFESHSGWDNFQTICMPSSYLTFPGLSIQWTGRLLVTDSGTKCAWVIRGSKAVQIHVHNNRRCLYVPWVPGSVKIRTTTTVSFCHVISTR